LPLLLTPYERAVAKVRREVIVEALGECWLFQGARDQNGHGNIRVQRKRPDGSKYWTCDKVHRVSHTHHFGKIPPGKVVRHACDVANCMRPEHVRELGTQADNVADMIARGRWRNGSSPPPCTTMADITGETADDCPF